MRYSSFITAAGLVASSCSHMIITSPAPYDKSSLSNGPLEPDGSNFPCKHTAGQAYEAEGASNVYELGSKQTLELQGTAVHGGGSCQLSITYDNPPSKDSVWKVIHSIQGGCPARDTPGNLPGDSADLADPHTYDYVIPSDIKAGDATLAWSWSNKIGNREFYMNCAPVTLQGTGGDRYDSLPDMYVGNLAGVNDCTNAAEIDLVYANAGDSVENNAGSPGFAVCGGKTMSADAAGDGAATTPATTPAAAAAAPAADTTPAPAAATTAASPAASATPASSAAAPVVAAAPVSSGGGAALSGACGADRPWNCVTGSSFQQCASGTWSAALPLAPGTACAAGQSASLQIVAAGKRRHARAFSA